MSAVPWKCLSCKRVVRPVRSLAGIAICPKCSGTVSLMEQRPLPTPRPVAVAGAARTRRGLRAAVGAAAMASSVEGATWAPSPAIARSPAAAASWRLADSAVDQIVSQPARRWTRSPSLWACAPAATILLVIAAVIFVNRSAAGPHHSSGAAPITSGSAAQTSGAAALLPGMTIDLMPQIDPARDAMGGKWARIPEGLISDGSRWAKVKIPCEAPEEYDFMIEFTATGNEDVAQVFSLGGHTCTWLMGGFKGTVCGLHQVNGKPASANPTTVRNYTMISGERHTSVLQVRKDFVAAILDGKPLMRHETDGSDLSTNSNWNTGPKSLGIGSYQNSTVFHRVELIAR